MDALGVEVREPSNANLGVQWWEQWQLLSSGLTEWTSNYFVSILLDRSEHCFVPSYERNRILFNTVTS